MTQNQTPAPRSGRLSISRAALFASAASVAIIAFAAGATSFNAPPPSPTMAGTTAAPAIAPTTISAVTLTPAAQPAPTRQAAGFADLVAKIRPAVVSVRVEIPGPTDVAAQSGDPFQFGQPNAPAQPGQQMVGEGSGFFITGDGYIVTNDHVVDHASAVQVTMDDGTVYKARVIGTDPKTDLAVIKVDANKTFSHVKFEDKPPRVGDWVVAVGNPFGLGNTVTAGIVSALNRDIGASAYDQFIQIDAPINRGNSGGPTFDLNGGVVGINSVIFSPSGGSVGIGFDIPADTAKAITDTLIAQGHITRGWLGVEIQDVTPDIAAGLGVKDAKGALVAQILPNSPAASSGLKAGDLITGVNGKTIKDGRQLVQEIGDLAPGTSVQLDVLRKAQTKQVALTLGTMPAQQQTPPA
jgi:serine protease Do